MSLRRLTFGLSLGLVVASLTLVAAGCGGGLSDLERLLPPGTFGSGSSSPFVGQFEETSISANGTIGNCPTTISAGGTSYSCDAIVRLFVSDGTFDDTSPSQDVGTGTWSVGGTNSQILTLTKNGVVSTWTAAFAPDQSYFVLTSGVLNQTWTKQ